MTDTEHATEMRRDPARAAIAVMVALAAMGAGCNAQLSSGGMACESDSDCSGARCVDGRCQVPRDGGEADGAASPTDLVALSISPEDAVIDLPDDPPTVSFTVLGRQRDGTMRPLTSGLEFTISDPALGTIDVFDGTFTAAGVGGSATVRALESGTRLSVTTTITVNWHGVVLGEGVSPTDPAGFDGAAASTDASVAPAIDYPLARAVMPRNVYPPNIMWTPHHAAGDGELWHVRLARPHAVLDGYFAASPGFTDSWQIPGESWAPMAGSDVGVDIELTVEVLSAGTRYASAASTFRTVDAVLGGSVYYWSPPSARLKRLDVQTASLVDFLPDPGDTCIGCHAVSRDGRRLIGVREPSETVTAFDITRDLTATPAPNLFAVHYDVRRCESFNPDSTFVVAGDCGANATSLPFGIIDMSTGAQDASLDGMAGDGFDPEWSPDGASIAFTNRDENLAVTPVMPGNHFGAPAVIHTASSSPDGVVDWHPTWTPDSQWLVYQHGDTRRTHEETGGSLSGTRGALWIIAPSGGTPVRLDNANFGATNGSYRPIFSPFDSGGYFWLLFTTLQDYGNGPAGIHGQKQVWVTAITNTPDGASDPSEVPYYLAGQEVATILSPQWVPPPCNENGVSCGSGTECCSGVCGPDPSGDMRCVPPSMSCRARGESCGGASDCCAGLVCTSAHLCDYAAPG